MSIGSAGYERTLTNVAAGRIAADSTDAINGSQLYLVAKDLQQQIASLDNYLTVNGENPKTNTDADAADSNAASIAAAGSANTDAGTAANVGTNANAGSSFSMDANDTTNVSVDNASAASASTDGSVGADVGNASSGNTTADPPTGDVPDLGGGYVSEKGNLSIKWATDANGITYRDISLKDNLDLGADGSIAFGDVNNTYIDANKIEIGDTHIANNQIKVGDEVTITNEQINVGDTYITENKIHLDDKHYFTNNEFKMGDVIVNDNSVSVGDTVTINNDQREFKVGGNVNVDMGDNIIHNVAPGVEDTDAVNVSQLKELNQDITNNSARISRLGSRINKVGAGAAALAGLHPLDFDPDDKFYFSAGYGHYRGENAVSVGAFYQPNDDTLFSVASTVGNDDDMISAGITWRFGQNSNQSRSKKAMAKEIIELRTEIAELKAMVYSLTGYGLDLEKAKLFPDTPENHWAYDYVAVVAGNGILEGYPNGKFDGSRPMTRYEMAAVVYRLLQKGVQVDNRMLQEFAPELARVRVDTLTHYNDGAPHIQRVRVIEGRG